MGMSESCLRVSLSEPRNESNPKQISPELPPKMILEKQRKLPEIPQTPHQKSSRHPGKARTMNRVNPLLDLIPKEHRDWIIEPVRAETIEEIYKANWKRLAYMWGVPLDYETMKLYVKAKTETLASGNSSDKIDTFLRHMQVKPTETVEHDIESVESTLGYILDNPGCLKITKECPFGMSPSQREKFCLSLDLLGYRESQGSGWKIFAEEVMDILPDDLTMIEHFSYQYRYPIVDILLEHWYKLYSRQSEKCLRPATIQTIQDVLREKQLIDILERNFG